MVSPLTAQHSGVVTYNKIIDYGIEPMGRPRWDNYIKTLPKTGTFVYTLSFKGAKSLFQEDISQREDVDPRLQRALNALPSFTPPKVKVSQVYQDIEKGEKLKQVEFMTRDFLVVHELEVPAWRITNQKKKVLDYVCVGAEMKTEDGTITAWFTSEIPVPFGPDGYHGLPGLIMGLEKDGNMLVLASKVTLNSLEKLHKPSDGQTVKQKAFDKIVEEKLKEWKENGGTGSRGKGRGGK